MKVTTMMVLKKIGKTAMDNQSHLSLNNGKEAPLTRQYS